MSTEAIQNWVIETMGTSLAQGPEKSARIVNQIMDKLNSELPPDVVTSVMIYRGMGCYEKYKPHVVKDFGEKAKNLNEFISLLDSQWENDPNGVTNPFKREGNILTAIIGKCPCPFVNKATSPIPLSYCTCSAGFYKGIFEDYLKQPVETQIIKSIVAGDFQCEIKITLPMNELEG
jgi:hypothetical protein